MDVHKFIRIPLYKLYYIDDVKKFNFDERVIGNFNKEYSPQEKM